MFVSLDLRNFATDCDNCFGIGKKLKHLKKSMYQLQIRYFSVFCMNRIAVGKSETSDRSIGIEGAGYVSRPLSCVVRRMVLVAEGRSMLYTSRPLNTNRNTPTLQ